MSFVHAEIRPAGRISLVGAGPGCADLLTLRALRHLQEADVVYYDRLIDPEVLALAPARKIFVGKALGANAWPQERINAVIVAAALDGQRVVRLKSGDPAVFGRACEEIEAAKDAGLPIEIVPGITAASAAAASLCRPLTERGATERLVIATATCRPGERASITASLAPGTTLALYMAMHRLAEVEADLLACGMPADTEAQVVQGAGTAAERVVATTLANLHRDVTSAGLGNPAIVFLRWPKAVAVELGAKPQAMFAA